MAGFLFRLETIDGVAADPPTLETAVPNWKPGDSISFGAGLVPGAAFVRGRDVARWRLAMPDASARVGDPGRFLFAVPLPLSASAPVFSESHAAEEALERRHHVAVSAFRPRSV